MAKEIVMVCIPCFAAPVLLFIWYKFIYPILQPILQRYFGDRWFALPQDANNCPVCPRTGKCDLKSTSNETNKEVNQELNQATSQETTSKKDD